LPSAYRKSGFRPAPLQKPAPARLLPDAPLQLPGGTLNAKEPSTWLGSLRLEVRGVEPRSEYLV